MNNSFTLNFNGVGFHLVPDSNEICQSDRGTGGVSVLPNADGKFTMIKMQSFSGTLYVSEQSSKSPMLAFDQSSIVNETPIPTQKSLATVEDEESPSPPTPSKFEEIEKQNVHHVKGQQQLTFERKKRVNSNDDTKKNTKKIKVSSHRLLQVFVYAYIYVYIYIYHFTVEMKCH